MPPSPLASTLRALAALLAAAAVHYALWRLGRRLPVAIGQRAARQGRGRPGSHLMWRQRVELVLLPAKLALWLAAAWFVSEQFPVLAAGRSWLGGMLAASFRRPLFTAKGQAFSALDILLLPVLLAGVWIAVSTLAWFVKVQVLGLTRLEEGVREGLTSLVRYALLFVGVILVLQVWGVDASTLAIVGSVLGVGIGFGLQNIANNFVSGLLLGLERPIKPGDYVEVGSFAGTVQRIGARSTVVLTQDRVSILVPNSRFLETEVINWSHGDPVSRLRLPLGVAYGSPVARVREALLEVARAHPDVLDDPEPEVDLERFGESALEFELEVWIKDPRRQNKLRSELNYGIEAALRRRGIDIPFPQRDLHLRSTQFDRLVDLWSRMALGVEGAEAARPPAAAPEEERPEDSLAVRRVWTDEDLRSVVERMRGPDGIPIRDRRHLLNVYPRCFVGREAIDWLQRQAKLSRKEALAVGRLMMERGILHHVLDEHGFEDGNLFYRFFADEAGAASG